MASSPPSGNRNNNANGEQRHPRVNKPDMFMNVALWMELSPLAESPDNFDFQAAEASRDDESSEAITESEAGNIVKQERQGSSVPRKPTTPPPGKVHKSGAVVVLPNDRALSVDCSQKGVHAAVSALIKFGQERVKGCQVYLSRRPCSFCAKLLVQCEVAKVFYLPIEPEWNDADDVHRVDNIFKASPTGLQIFIPKVREIVLNEVTKTPSPFAKSGKADITDKRRALEEQYWSDEWVVQASTVLRWNAFANEKMRTQTIKDMKNLIRWIAKATYADVPDEIKFAEIDPETKMSKEKKIASGGEIVENGHSSDGEIPEVPTSSDPNWQGHALHMCRMAQMLSQRSDDPTNRVGCILMFHNEVVAIGWNGFPAKSLFGEFPHGSTTNQSNQTGEKKEHYVIHAEQNALLTRNKRNLNHDSSVLYTNKIPAAECVPMLMDAGVRNVVVPQEPPDSPENVAFFKALKRTPVKIVGFWPTTERETAPVSRRLFDEPSEN